MKKISDIICLVLLLGLGAACSLLDKNDGDTPRKDTGRADSTDIAESLSPYDTIIYIAGVQFPEGYDWQIDTMAAEEKGELVLYKGTELLVSVPVSYDNCVSADPDMFRIADGHLYSDFCDNKQTIVKCDGKEIFRYDGREQMCGFAVKGKDVWTLGQDRSGEGGLSLRKNGKVVHSHEGGFILGNLADTYNRQGALSFVDGEPVFFYYYIGQGALSRSTHCVMVKGTSTTELDVPKNFNRIMDAKLIDGVPVMVGQMGTTRNMLSIVKKGTVVSYTLVGFDKLGNCRITPVGDGNLLLSGECFASGLVTGYICDKDGNNLFYDIEGRLIGLYVSEGIDVILSCGENGADPTITTNGRSVGHAGRYLYISAKSAVLLEKLYFIALNPAGKERPFLLRGSKKSTIDFNGFVSELDIQVVKKEER